MQVTKKLIYLEHSSGTKFYEVAVFSCAESNEFWTVRRWGKIAASNVTGGGETLVENHMSATKAENHANATVKGKESRGYVERFLSFALKSGTSDIDADVFGSRVVTHYGSGGANLVANMNLSYSPKIRGVEADSIVFDELNHTPKVEPARGDTWGSW